MNVCLVVCDCSFCVGFVSLLSFRVLVGFDFLEMIVLVGDLALVALGCSEVFWYFAFYSCGGRLFV